MSRCSRLLTALAMLVALWATPLYAGTQYLITNNNVPMLEGNSASIFSVESDGSLTLTAIIPTKGNVQVSGILAGNYVQVLRSQNKDCIYVDDVWGVDNELPSDVDAIDMSTKTLVGTYRGFPLDDGGGLGVSLVGTPDGHYMFAAFNASNTIAIYQVQQQGCGLKRVSEIIAVGGRTQFGSIGAVNGMKVTPNGKFLIVAYGDSTFGSYSIDPNTGALKLISRYLVGDGGFVTGIDITSDSRWAVFGVATTGAEVELAAIHEDGTLGPTTGYPNIGTGSQSENVWLSPDETILYIGNAYSGQITAVPFNRTTGVVSVSQACTSPDFMDLGGMQYFLTGLMGSSGSPSGSPMYATTSGFAYSSPLPAAIVIANFVKPCTWTESPSSPVFLPQAGELFGVALDPPRSF